MYLDDIREPKNNFDVIVRSYDEAVAFINKNGIPNFISFDHDLACDNNGIILLIADHMDWRDEYQHLVMLQEKINVYITFLEQKQYEDIYKGENITYGIIEIHFLYNLTANAEKFLQSVQNQVAELGVKIQYCVSQE